jgi:hypothetical protein
VELAVERLEREWPSYGPGRAGWLPWPLARKEEEEDEEDEDEEGEEGGMAECCTVDYWKSYGAAASSCDESKTAIRSDYVVMIKHLRSRDVQHGLQMRPGNSINCLNGPDDRDCIFL